MTITFLPSTGDVGLSGSDNVIQPNVVTTPKINDGAVTAAKTGFSVGFAGNLMGTHQHELAQFTDNGMILQSFKRLQTDTPTDFIQTGATLLQATTGATATVVSWHGGVNMADVNTIVGGFDNTHLVTFTNPDLSTGTFTPRMGLLDVWAFSGFATYAFFGVGYDVTVGPFQVINTYDPNLELMLPGTVQGTFFVRFNSNFTQIESLKDDGFTAPAINFLGGKTTFDSAGTPSGTNTIS